MLGSTFVLWPPDAETLITLPEDRLFLQSMKGDRAASFGAFDKKLAQKVDRRNSREAAAAQRLRRAQTEKKLLSSKDIHIESIHDNDTENISTNDESDDDDDTSEPPAVKVSRKTLSGTAAFIPRDILSRRNIVSLATRLKITPTQQAAFTQEIILESSGDVSMVAASYATADRSRRKVVSDIALQIRDEWRPPKLCTLHWDGKLMPTLRNNRLQTERLSVTAGDADELKLLGVPSYMKGSDESCGSIIADLTFQLTEQWNCSDRIVNMTFDTTKSNTGHLTAACIAIQNKLEKALLWSGCRHHIGEVLLTQVFTDLQIEQTRSPDITLFTRLQRNWNLVPHNSAEASPFRPEDHSSEAQDLLTTLKTDLLKNVVKVTNYLRDDYREFADLSLVYLNAVDKPLNFHHPGALHRARWMAKVIYCLKISLNESQIKGLIPGTITTKQQLPKVHAFSTFIAHVYCSWWLMCGCAVDAPWNDLQLYKFLLQYTVVDKLIANSAVKAFSRHLWYLTAEMIPLALFSQRVPCLERKALADALLRIKPSSDVHTPLHRFGNGWGKPVFPSIITESTRLCDLVSIDSWFTISLLQLDVSFLELPVSEWNNTAAYISSANNTKAINVINDCAERGIKLSSDFNETARTDEHFQNVLQVVEQNRKSAINFRLKSACNDSA